MDMELSNVEEFIPWVLQFGSDAKVLARFSYGKFIFKLIGFL